MAENRIIPELIRGFSEQNLVIVCNPLSTRPWQHVLNPLRGYIMELEEILNGSKLDKLNLGPDTKGLKVGEIVKLSIKYWPSKTLVEFSEAFNSQDIEVTSLNLDSKKAREMLGWNSRWGQEESVQATIKWWNKVLNNSISPTEACTHDIDFLL